MSTRIEASVWNVSSCTFYILQRIDKACTTSTRVAKGKKKRKERKKKERKRPACRLQTDVGLIKLGLQRENWTKFEIVAKQKP